jgi:hypothetical protein
MRINIKTEDLEFAVRRDACFCAIACAIQRQRPRATHVIVNTKRIAWTEDGQRLFFMTPKTAVNRIIKPWDLGEDLKPTSFELSDQNLIEIREPGTSPETQITDRNRKRKARKAHGTHAYPTVRSRNRFTEYKEALEGAS